MISFPPFRWPPGGCKNTASEDGPAYPRVREEGPSGPQTHFLVDSLPLSRAPLAAQAAADCPRGRQGTCLWGPVNGKTGTRRGALEGISCHHLPPPPPSWQHLIRVSPASTF